MNKLTEKQISFIEHFVELNDATKAYYLAGYAKGDKSNAHKLVRRLSVEINEALQSRMATSTSLALKTLESIMASADTAPRDRINAANSWLDRTGISRASTVAIDRSSSERAQNLRRIRNGCDVVALGRGDHSLYLPTLNDSHGNRPKIDDPTQPDWDLNDKETVSYLSKNGYFS